MNDVYNGNQAQKTIKKPVSEDKMGIEQSVQSSIVKGHANPPDSYNLRAVRRQKVEERL